MSFSTAAILLTWVALALLGLALSGLLRQVHQLTKAQIEGTSSLAPVIRSAAPALEDEVHRASWSAPTLVLFADADCTGCEHALPEFSRLAGHPTDGLDFVVAFAGEGAWISSPSIRVIQRAAGAFRRFSVSITPYIVFINRQGFIERAQPVGSPELLREFIEDVRNSIAKGVRVP